MIEPGGVFTYVFVTLDVLQNRPLFMIPVISSLSVGLELLHSSGGGPAGADLIHRGWDSLSEPRLNGPELPEDLKQHRFHALVHPSGRQDVVGTRGLGVRAGLWEAAVSHRQSGRRRRQLVDRRRQLQEVHSSSAGTGQRQPTNDPPRPAVMFKTNIEQRRNRWLFIIFRDNSGTDGHAWKMCSN